MRHHIYIVLSIVLIVIAIPVIAFAGFGSNTLFRALGGRTLLVGPTAEIQYCAGIGPITIEPFNGAIDGPYFIRNATNGVPRSGGFILALYSQVPDVGSCYNASGAPVPAYEITLYGTSR